MPMEKRFTDIHTHILFGIDDGPKDKEQMFAMLRRASEEGIARIIATSHIEPGVHAFPYEKYDLALECARGFVRDEGLEIKIASGSEMLFSPMAPVYLREKQVPTLAGTDYILAEFMPDISFRELQKSIDKILAENYRVVIAHAERIACLRYLPKRCEALKAGRPVRIQLNCAAVLSGSNAFVRRFANYILKHELADAVASDAHNTSSRPCRMREAYDVLEKIFSEAYARRLTYGSFLSE